MGLRGFDNVFESLLMNELQDNLVQLYDWHLLCKGNYFNSSLGETDYNGNDYSLLQISDNANFTPGQAWEGFRKNWIWQSGVDNSPPPKVGTDSDHPGISGVYVNDTFYPNDAVGTYAHHVDYYNGRVVFDNPLPTGSKVQAEHSYKYMNVVYASSLPWLREIQYRSLDLDNAVDSPNIPEFRVQLPAIAIEVVPRRVMSPFEMGSLSQIVDTDVLFHCVAEDEITRNQMLDIISFQNDTLFGMFDSNEIISNGVLPIDYRGSPNPNALRYPELIADYPKSGSNVIIKNSMVQGMEILNSNLFVGIVRCTLETIKS
jgi:hypothetical protein